MSKKKALLSKIADHNKKLAELQKQIKDLEIAEQLKVGEAALAMYHSGKWDGDKLKQFVADRIGDELSDESSSDDVQHSSKNDESNTLGSGIRELNSERE